MSESPRNATRRVRAGRVEIGGGAPIPVQSMCATSTQDVVATVAQIEQLRRAGESYDQFVGSLDGRVLVSARRFKELGVSASKEIADVAPLHLDVREPRAVELRVPIQERLDMLTDEISQRVETT